VRYGSESVLLASHVSDPWLAPEDRFRNLYGANFVPLLGYALRRADDAEDAADVVSETFLVAWRRLPEVPEEPAARLWLYGVARRVLANQRRGSARRGRLGERLRHDLTAAVPDHADMMTASTDLNAALSRLRTLDREVLQLTAWEGLDPRGIATVLNVPAGTVRTRLSRARARLRRELGDDPSSGGHVPSDPLTTAPRKRRESR
jgi:RNA polymerase sigma factor (sigma-70 family)